MIATTSSLLKLSSLSEQKERLLSMGCVILAMRSDPGSKEAQQAQQGSRGFSRIAAGHILLVEAFPGIEEMSDFSVIAAVEASKPPRQGKQQDRMRGMLCLMGFIAVILLNGLSILPLATAVLILDFMCFFGFDFNECLLSSFSKSTSPMPHLYSSLPWILHKEVRFFFKQNSLSFQTNKNHPPHITHFLPAPSLSLYQPPTKNHVLPTAYLPPSLRFLPTPRNHHLPLTPLTPLTHHLRLCGQGSHLARGPQRGERRGPGDDRLLLRHLSGPHADGRRAGARERLTEAGSELRALWGAL